MRIDFPQNICYNAIKARDSTTKSKKSKSKGFKNMNESDIKELEFKELWEQLNEENKNEIYGRLYEYIEENARERRNNENYY